MTYYRLIFVFSLLVYGAHTALAQSDGSFLVGVTITEEGPSLSEDGGARLATRISHSDINTTHNSANINVETNIDTTLVLRWGKTAAYEIGHLDNLVFTNNHGLVINDLESDTIYELEIIVYDRYTNHPVIKRMQFETLGSEMNVTLPNVSRFNVKEDSGDIVLSWSKPSVADFSHVRVVSNDLFYPADEHDGWFVYEGDKERVIDSRVLREGSRYYSVFTYDATGNRSSGAVAMLRVGNDEDNGYDGVNNLSTLDELSPSDLSISQGGINVSSGGGIININNNSETKFSISYDTLPEHLKTVVVTLRYQDSPEDTFSFLMSVNADKTAYEATIGKLVKPGLYFVTVEVFDYKTKVVSRTQLEIVVVEQTVGSNIEYYKSLIKVNWWLITSIGLASCFFILWLVKRRFGYWY